MASHKPRGPSATAPAHPPRQRPKPRPKSRPRLLWPGTPRPPPPPPPVHPMPPQHQHHHQQQQQALAQAQWSPHQHSLEDLLRLYPLPLLVQCRSHVVRYYGDDRPFPLLLDNKPMLLAEQRTARHLLARVVVFDERSRSFSESPDTVVIPEDYEGNFLRLHCRTTKDKSHVQSLEAIAHDDTPAFLNLSDITSFPANPRDPSDQSKFLYTMGNVFLVDEPVRAAEASSSPTDGLSRLNSASSGSSRHRSATTSSSEESGGNGLMRCLDERGVAVVVPTDQAGEMVAVQKNADQRPKLSMKSREMMMAGEQFPVLARYAYGKTPPRLTAFSKLFTLLDSFEETSIIACTLHGPNIMLMELPRTSTLQFQAALNTQHLLNRAPRLRNALHACRTRGRELARDIKFKLKFSHRFQETTKRPKEEEVVEEKVKGGVGGSGQGQGQGFTTIRTRLVVTETYVYI